MSRVEIIGDATLHLGDCRDVELPASAALVSDPPYGMGWDTRTARFSGGQEHHRRRRDGFGGRSDWSAIVEDNTPFEPARWLGYERDCRPSFRTVRGDRGLRSEDKLISAFKHGTPQEDAGEE